MATTGLGSLVAGIANIANLKCCCPLCCFCANTLCADFTNPDWDSWGCSGSVPFTAPGEIKLSMGLTINTIACGTGGSTQAIYSDTAFDGTYLAQLLPQCGPFVGQFQMAAVLEVYCNSSTSGAFRIRYSGAAVVSIADSTGEPCVPVPAITVTLSTIVVVFGTPPVPVGSLSPTSLTVNDGPCTSGMSAMRASAPATRTTLCTSLGERIEYRAGCDSGWMCKHACNSTDPAVVEHLGGVMEAVPGSDCQDCPGYTPHPP